jgi:thioredoxin 1
MINENQEKDKKKTTIKIIVPVLILFIVIGIWFIKDSQRPSEIKISDNPDFALHVTEEIDLEKLKSYGIPIIIDFGADSCIPCKEMAPALAKLNEELQGKAIFKFVDVWKYQELAEGYPISVISTQMFFGKNGKPYTPSDCWVL